MKNQVASSVYWRALASRHPSAFLLIAQLLSLVLYAVIDESSSGQVLIGAFGILVLVLVVWVINRSPSIRRIAWILVVPAFALSLLSIFTANLSMLAWSALLGSILYFYAAGNLVAYMMKDYLVTIDELFAAGATFTLLAWGFAYAYQACQTWFPGSLVGTVYQGQPWSFVELLSLSFTNLSATGLGDILPVAPPARVLVMLEQFSGIAYVAIVVSRLVGMTITRQTSTQAS